MFHRIFLAVFPLIALCLLASSVLAGHHHRYYQSAYPAYYAAPMVYAPPAPAQEAPQSGLLEILLPILLERARDNVSHDRGSVGDAGGLRDDLRKMQADLADFRKEHAATNESMGVNLQRLGQEMATVRDDLQKMREKLDSVAAATSSSSSLQTAVGEMRARFPQRARKDIRATFVGDLTNKVNSQTKLDDNDKKALIEALTKDFDTQLDAAFPNWKE